MVMNSFHCCEVGVGIPLLQIETQSWAGDSEGPTTAYAVRFPRDSPVQIRPGLGGPLLAMGSLAHGNTIPFLRSSLNRFQILPPSPAWHASQSTSSPIPSCLAASMLGQITAPSPLERGSRIFTSPLPAPPLKPCCQKGQLEHNSILKSTPLLTCFQDLAQKGHC